MSRIFITSVLSLFSTFALAAGQPPVTFDINKDSNGFNDFADCKKNLQDTVLAAIGLIDSAQTDTVKKIRDGITFSRLTEVKSTHCGMGSPGCTMTTATGSLQATSVFFAGQFTIEFGKGACNVISVSLQEQEP